MRLCVWIGYRAKLQGNVSSSIIPLAVSGSAPPCPGFPVSYLGYFPSYGGNVKRYKQPELRARPLIHGIQQSRTHLAYNPLQKLQLTTLCSLLS